MDGAAPAQRREVEVLVYVREHGDGAFTMPVGYRATIGVGGDGVECVTLRPLVTPEITYPIAPHSAIWRVAEAFLMVLPTLRHKAAMQATTRIA